MTRLPPVTRESVKEELRDVFDEVSSGPGGDKRALVGMFQKHRRKHGNKCQLDIAGTGPAGTHKSQASALDARVPSAYQAWRTNPRH